MNGFIKNFLTFSAVIGVCFGAYAFIQQGPATELARLEKKIEDERKAILAYVDAKDAAKTLQIQSVNDNLNFTRSLILRRIDRMDEEQRMPATEAGRRREDDQDGG